MTILLEGEKMEKKMEKEKERWETIERSSPQLSTARMSRMKPGLVPQDRHGSPHDELEEGIIHHEPKITTTREHGESCQII